MNRTVHDACACACICNKLYYARARSRMSEAHAVMLRCARLGWQRHLFAHKTYRAAADRASGGTIRMKLTRLRKTVCARRFAHNVLLIIFECASLWRYTAQIVVHIDVRVAAFSNAFCACARLCRCCCCGGEHSHASRPTKDRA